VRHGPDFHHSNWKGLPFCREHHEHFAELNAPSRRFSRRGPLYYVVTMSRIIRGVTAPRPGREFTANLVRTSRGTVDFSRILDVGWPHIVSNLDASLDLVTTAALSLLAQEANRSASPAHICSPLFPSPPHLHRTKLSTTLAIISTATTTQVSCGKPSKVPSTQ
jgi:hypothetical protein